jgi:hypothetical protein
MKFWVHLVRWDVRRFGMVLFAWLLLVAATATLDGLWPALSVDPTTRYSTGLVASLLSLAEVLFSFVVVALVVHAHPAVGVKAFWTTRPIPPRTLLAAKLTLLAVAMIAAPVVADVFLMAAYRVQPADIAAVSAQSALFWAFLVVVIMVGAVLTPNLAAFALLVGGGVVSLAVALAITVAVLFARLEDSPTLSGQPSPHDPTAGIVSSSLTIAALVGLLLSQYCTRLRPRSCAIGVAGVVIAHLIGSAWPWPVLAPIEIPPSWSGDSAALSLAANPDTVSVEADRNWERPSDWKQARARVRMSGIPPGWTADVGVREATVRLSGGAPLIARLPGRPTSVPIGEDERPQVREVTRRLLEVDTLADSSAHSSAESTVVLFARTPDIERLAPTQGAYEGLFRIFLTQHEIEAVLPLRPGSTYQNQSHRFSVIRVQSNGGDVSIIAEQSNAVSILSRRPHSNRSVYLRNRRRSEAIQGSSYELRQEIALMRLIPFAIGVAGERESGFRVRADMLQFPPMYGAPEGLPFALDAAWIDESELVIVRSTERGSVDRRLAVANFPIRLN